MLNITEADRHYLVELRALTTDEAGNEVLVGLTTEESQWYLDYSKRTMTSRDPDDGSEAERYLRLNDRHEIARREAIVLESEARQSTRH